MNGEGQATAQQGSLDRPTMFASLRQPGYLLLYAAGFLFGTARWGLGFLAAFMANELTGSPRAVQLTGAALWAPLFLAGVPAGWLADRFDRRALLVGTVALLTPAVVAVGLLALSGRLVVLALYPLMVGVGLAQLVELTSRRPLVLDVVGPDLIDNAMALEALATAFALALGVIAGGALIELLGVGQAFLVIAGLMILAGVAFTLLKGDGPVAGRAVRKPIIPGSQGLRSAIRSVVDNRRLRTGLAVTVVANMFYFSHTPLVPLLAGGLGAGPLGAGLLASAGGLGMMVSSLAVARLQPPRGISYLAGTGIALVAIMGVGFLHSFIPVFGALLVAALGFGVFASTQSAVIMTSVDREHRGRAMGLMSMAIGSLPVGMYSLGEVAERVGAPRAIVMFAGTGLVVLLVWIVPRRAALSAG